MVQSRDQLRKGVIRERVVYVFFGVLVLLFVLTLFGIVFIKIYDKIYQKLIHENVQSVILKNFSQYESMKSVDFSKVSKGIN